MSTRRIGIGSVVATALVCILAACSTPRQVDVILRGAVVYDGSGATGRPLDVAIDGGRIVALGDVDRFVTDRDMDLRGLALAPGFVDMHSHADLILLADETTRARLLEAKIRQGVTTIVTGNCGLGAAPAGTDGAAILAAVNGWMTPEGVSPGALTTRGYLDRLEQSGIPLNVATLVPHGPLRIDAMGLAPGAPEAAQAETMRAALRESLDAGAFGLSVGLIYPPGMYSDTAELIDLARVVAERDGLFTAHVRGSSEMLAAATDELLEIARAADVRAHHSHLEAVGEPFWSQIGAVLEAEASARGDERLRVTHDAFPYTRAATMMVAIFPPWSLSGGVPALLDRLENPATRERIRRDIETRTPEWPPWREGGWPHNLVGAVGWDGIYVASVGPDGPTNYVGRDLAAIAAEKGRPPFDVVADLMLAERGRVGQLVGEISGDVGRIDHLLEILSRGAIVSDAEDYGRGVPHPAHAGAFARALRLNRERGLLDDGEMIRRMTAYPAEIVGLENVGRLQPGAVADLVVLDLERVEDRASWDEPRAFAAGIEGVMIGGEWTVHEGRYIPSDRGRVLRKPPAGTP